ncbi:MAG: hypothetical protein WA824_10795 [Candidatus Sulfotelmatobacter sp.]
MSQKPTRSSDPGKEQSEFGKFSRLLNKLLSVPHSKIKAELEAEKSQPRKLDWATNRAKRRHAYRDADGVD